MLTMTPPTSTPAMRSAASMASRAACSADRKIDHCAAFDAVRPLMADAEHLAAVGAPAQRLRRLHRRQPRDQANDLRSADVEHRQQGALARRDLAHARGERLSSWLGALLGRVGLRPGGGRLLGQAHEHPARNPEIEREHVLLQDAGLALEASAARRSRLRGSISGSLTSMPDFNLQIPAPLVDQHARFDARLQFVHRVEQGDELAHPPVRALADDEGKVGVSAVADLVDRRAIGCDRVDLAVLLPDGVGRALDDLDHDADRDRVCARSPA